MIRKRSTVAAILLALARTDASAQGTRRGLPEPLPLAAPSASPGLGTTPGALEASEFSPQVSVISGGRARGGAGRVPRKVSRTRQAPSQAPARGVGALPAPLSPDDKPADALDDPDSGASGLVLDDEGASDGLTLDAALDRLMAANLDLLALKCEIPQADADILTASLRANPFIFGDAQLIPYGAYSSARPVGPTEYDVNITHPLDLSHKRQARMKVARAAKSTIEAQFQDAARRQVGNLYRAFVDLQSARLDHLTAEAAWKEQDQALGRARQRAGGTRELSKFLSRSSKARDALDDARDALDDARESVALLLNLPPDEASRLQPRGSLHDPSGLSPPLEDLIRLATGNRPDLVAARRGIGRAESEIKLAKATRFDDVFLFYDPYSYQDNRLSKQPSGRSWAIGLTVPLPLYNRNQGNIARANINLNQSQVELAALERRIVSEVRIAERECRTSRQAFERSKRAIRPEAAPDRAKATAELEAGSIGLAEYLERVDEDEDAAKDYRDALIRHRRAMLDLNTALGVRFLP